MTAKLDWLGTNVLAELDALLGIAFITRAEHQKAVALVRARPADFSDATAMSVGEAADLAIDLARSGS